MTDVLARPTLLERYLARTPRSQALFDRAQASLPGGSTRTTVYAAPYPPYIDRGEGAWIRDVDGNRYLDLIGNYTSLVLGHAHPDVVVAVREQVSRSSAFAAPTELEVLLAEEIRARLPSIERLRFTNSGTEATMFAVRAARAFTGRDMVVTFERGYHGTHDLVASPPTGVPEAVRSLRIEAPWDDPAGLDGAVAERQRQVAAILVEPVQAAGGVRAGTPAFLAALRDWATQHGALLIFDEVISFRLGPSGWQGVVGVTPDLTSLGKIVGGGYPMAAFGGRADVMAQFDARRAGALSHGGTFNGNPVAAAAGLATLRALTAERIAALNAAGERLVERARQVVQAAGTDGGADGVGSLFQLRPVSGITAADLFLGLLLEGVYVAPRGMGALSTAVSEGDVDHFVNALAPALRERGD